MKQNINIKHSGFVLIEALIALLVVAVGVLGISKLNALLMQGTGSAKTQAEALQIAQGLIEDLRNYQLEDACAATTLDAGTTTLPTISGVNASFTAQTTIAAGTTAGLRTVEACLTWNGGACNTVGNRIILRSVISCEGMGTNTMTGPGGAAGLRGNFVKTPTGRGLVTGEIRAATDGTNNTVKVGSDTYNDGTRTFNNTTNGTLELIDSNNRVVLSVKKYDGCETSPPAFSIISGKVLISAKNGNPIAADSDLFVLSSDASFCAKVPRQSSWVLPAGASGNDIEYFYTYYQCYLGAEWWGNIGLVRTDNATANERVCVGSPVNDATSIGYGTLFSKIPVGSRNRAYRGYRQISEGVFVTKGIGELESKNDACSTATKRDVYNYQPTHLANHDFVHATLTGSETCATVMADLNTTANAKPLGSAMGNPTVTCPNPPPPGTPTTTVCPNTAPDYDTTAPYKIVSANNNPGRYYCLSNNDGVSCGAVTENPTNPSTTIQGTITRIGSGELTGVSGTAASCTFQTLSGTTYGYSCTVDWSSFPSSSWSGKLTFASNNPSTSTTCAAGATITKTPTDATVSYTINDNLAATDKNSIVFSEIAVSTTNVVIDFNVKSTPCVLGQPQLSDWVYTSNNTDNATATLTWPAITGATSYVVRTCNFSNPANNCAPTGAGTDIDNTLSYTAPTGTADYKMCVTVSAKDATTETSSSIKCVDYDYNSGNSKRKYTTITG